MVIAIWLWPFLGYQVCAMGIDVQIRVTRRCAPRVGTLGQRFAPGWSAAVAVEAAEELPVDLTGRFQFLGAPGQLFLGGEECGFELSDPGGGSGSGGAGCGFAVGQVVERFLAE